MKKIKYLAALMACTSLANAEIINLTDPSLETAFQFDITTPVAGWYSWGNTQAEREVGAASYFQISNEDGPYAALAYSVDEHTGGSIFQTVELDAGKIYRLTAGVATSGWIPKNDAKFALAFYNADRTTALAQDTRVMAANTGAFADYSVYFTPTATTNYVIGLSDKGYVPGTSANNNQSTVMFDNVRLEVVSSVPVEPVIISSLSATPAAVTNGGTTTISWLVSNATGLSIDQGIGDVTGLTSTQVVVTTNTTYTLTATNALGSTNASTSVTILPPGSLLIDPSLELTFGGSSGSPNTGWFTDTTALTKSAVPVGPDTYWGGVGEPGMINKDGPNAAQIASLNENDGGTLYQSVELDANTIYRFTVGVTQSGWVAKNNGKYALVFYNSNFSELKAATTNIAVAYAGDFADDYVEFTTTSDGIYNVGMRNQGYVPGTGADNDGATIFFDNARLTVEGFIIPSDPINNITFGGPVVITGGQGMTISWDTSKRQPYHVQYKNDLVNDPIWTSIITNLTGTGSEISVTTTVNNAETFYRVVTP